MISSDYVLELCNVFHSGQVRKYFKYVCQTQLSFIKEISLKNYFLQVEPSSCLQRMFGSLKTGVILKDVSLTVHSGEVLAVLGSKGILLSQK